MINDNTSNNTPKRENIQDLLNKYKDQHNLNDNNVVVTGNSIPKPVSYNPQTFEQTMSKETDPDLMISYEVVKLPSKGLFYQNHLSEVNVEYMTSKDEDLLTTPSLIENGSVIDILLKRKIKTPGVIIENLLEGDKNAIILFLRTSSYGTDYNVEVTDPRNRNKFDFIIDLTKLEYKEITKTPDENGHFSIEIPMRKKTVKFKLLTTGEDSIIEKKAKAIQEAYNEEFSQYSTLKLKSHIISIDGNTDRSYIDKFVDAMPALDAYTIRKEIKNVSPDINMKYTFVAPDGFNFEGYLALGVDFFFPNI